jgi:putative heme-binding domain-containing protein
MWALHVTGGLKEKGLMAALNNNDPHIRAWAIQLLGEDKLFAPEAISKFAEMAATNNAPVVRLYLASALQRMDLAARWKIAEGLMRHKEDENDHNLPKMVWFGIEPLIKEHTQRALSLAAQSEIPMLAEYISRRTVDAGGIESLIAALDKMGKNKVSVLEGIRDGLEGRSDVKAPAGWKSAYLQLKTSGGKLAKLAQEVAEQFGDIDAVNQSLLILKNTKAPAEQRRKALQLLVSKQRQEIVKVIPALLNSPELKIDAIRAISGFENDALGKMLIERFNQFKQSEKNEMLQTMSSRPKYGWMLTEALSRKTISKNEVPPYVARQLLRVVGSGFVEVWGPIEENPTDKKAYTKYQKLLSDRALSSANLAKGKTLFTNSCGPCHKLYGEGGSIGPDITGSNRSNLDYLLFNILDPSGEIQDDYKMVVVTTRNGRTYTGNVRSENDRQLTLKVVGQEAVIKSDIQSREVTPVSMMPTGLLNGLTDAQVVDLIGYLRNAAPVKK